MKQFHFSLSTVHKFKNQTLDNLKNQHAMILAAVIKQEELILQLEENHRSLNMEFNVKNLQGITIIEAMGYKRYLKTLEGKIKEENGKLTALKESEEEKKQLVIEAKKEVASFDKLKEKRFDEYQKAVQKKEELFVEEFVSNRTYING